MLGYHDIQPLVVGPSSHDNMLVYLPTIDVLRDVHGYSETRNVIVDYIRANRLRHPERNIERNKTRD